MIIEARGVTKRFRARDGGIFTAVEEINLEVRDNEFLSIIGPSGCGKTTFLKMINGLIRPDEGGIWIHQKPVQSPRKECAMVFQNFSLLPWADALRNVAFPLEIRNVPRKEREERAREKLAAVGLKDFEHHYPHELSGGMQQRVGLARAMVADPQILLMDEPFGALDAQTRHLLQEELLELWQQDQKTVVFVTHAMDEAVYLSDRVVIMSTRPGRIHEILEIPLGRPRSPEIRTSGEFVELTNYIWETLKTLMGQGAAAR